MSSLKDNLRRQDKLFRTPFLLNNNHPTESTTRISAMFHSRSRHCRASQPVQVINEHEQHEINSNAAIPKQLDGADPSSPIDIIFANLPSNEQIARKMQPNHIAG